MARQSKPDVFFTERETQVLDLQMQGLNDKEIARKLNISEGTVGTYKTRIRYKIQMIERFYARKDKKK